MALNIKDPEAERLAAEVAELAGESKTGAVRQALLERKERLLLARGGDRAARIRAVVERHAVPGVRAPSKEEEEEILGFGPEGV